MVLYPSRMCRCVLHAVLWSLICVLMCLFAEELHSTADFYFPLNISAEQSWWPVFDGVGLAGFKSRANAFLLAYLLAPSLYWFPFLFFHSIGWYWGLWVFGLIGCQSLSPSLVVPTFLNNNIKSKSNQFNQTELCSNQPCLMSWLFIYPYQNLTSIVRSCFCSKSTLVVQTYTYRIPCFSIHYSPVSCATCVRL